MPRSIGKIRGCALVPPASEYRPSGSAGRGLDSSHGHPDTLGGGAVADDPGPALRLELQADCFAGVWAHSRYVRGQLPEEDFVDALRAAAVVGSDFQQHLATGTIKPEDWTHGSSRQRQHWLTTGFEQGKPSACDTFGA
jgi:predicted metalloprotease